MTTPLSPALPLRGASCPPPLALEEAVTEAAPPDLLAHLESCTACRDYLAALRREASAFLSARPADRFLAQLAVQRKPRRRFPLGVGATAALAALAAIVVAVLPGQSPRRDDIRLKGSLLTAYVQRDGKVHALESNEKVHPRDALRFVVRVDRSGYAAVFERDPDGKLGVVAPFAATQAQAVAAGTTPLGDSAVLDQTPGPERFTLVLSPVPFATAAIQQALEGGKPPCDGCRTELLELDKQP